jgi:(E)-4-hydroxy-3-methylbut-2-enyl-diphosphate synthase
MTAIAERSPYCQSRFETVRRPTREVRVGEVRIGGDRPIVVQSMTTTATRDVEATVRQSIALAEAGCEVVRITAQNVKAAEALGEIRKRFTAAGFSSVPLVADIHFLPQAAMEAVKHVEKVRINPGNYADKKKFQVKEYSESEYDSELQRLYEAFSPIVLRCRELGRAMRIGTNHGSLSDRIMNRYGDTPMGMCESALEFIRIAESHGFHDIILSMKASNPKVMIQAYRLIVARMEAEGMHYPLHLGVTEAGDGDDARIKSAIGIGSLLYDGLGDTIRVSLTEDPVAEIPVARALADKAMSLWKESARRSLPDPVDPYAYQRRKIETLQLGSQSRMGPMEPPLVIQPGPEPDPESTPDHYVEDIRRLQAALKDARIEGLLLDPAAFPGDCLAGLRRKLKPVVDFVVWRAGPLPPTGNPKLIPATEPGDLWLLESGDPETVVAIGTEAARCGARLALATSPDDLARFPPQALCPGGRSCILTLSGTALSGTPFHPLGRYRQLAEVAGQLGLNLPFWIRNGPETLIEGRQTGFGDRLLEGSMLTGSLLCDGIGDLVSIETVPPGRQATTLAYDILQGARARTTKTEYVACPSCGRTLFDLQSTTRKIRDATGHLKGVTIAVMGCIVNGPGEMADADFGYVGGAPGKVNLYVGKECVQYHIPADEAVEALIELIRQHGKWTDPPADG